jgi:methylmalonyl-CoA/ethylmalonyl-CoA epimerase
MIKQIDNNQLIKIGIVVDNIEDAAKHYSKLFGIEMPTIQIPDLNHTPEPTENSYTWQRGEMRPTRTKYANMQMGPVTVELLEPYDEPSPWNEFKKKHGQGVHFIAFTVNGFNTHINLMEQEGYALNHKGEYGSGRYSYFDTDKQLGVILGLQEMGPKQD